MTKSNTKKKLIVGLLTLLLIGLVLVTVNGIFGPSLSSIHSTILQDYSNVKHVNADQFSKLLSNELIVFDVREQAEFAVSHLSNAVRLDPTITPSDFEGRYGSLLANKTVIFYCSVGRRSSALASDLEDVLEDNQAAEFYNLEGGIFRWHNEGRPLMTTDQQQTQKVHPYNAFWGQLINDSNAIVY